MFCNHIRTVSIFLAFWEQQFRLEGLKTVLVLLWGKERLKCVVFWNHNRTVSLSAFWEQQWGLVGLKKLSTWAILVRVAWIIVIYLINHKPWLTLKMLQITRDGCVEEKSSMRRFLSLLLWIDSVTTCPWKQSRTLSRACWSRTAPSLRPSPATPTPGAVSSAALSSRSQWPWPAATRAAKNACYETWQLCAKNAK